ncbi:TPA: restriction endonuclease subunit S, partial [Klebsiella michiganensis]
MYDVRDGTHDTPKYQSEGYPLVTSKNLSSGKLNFDDIKFISKEAHEKIKERSFVEFNDILFAMIGSIGNPAIVDTQNEFSIKNVALFKYYSKDLSVPEYLRCVLESLSLVLRNISSGGVQPFVSLSTLRNTVMALPPLAEQYRIVVKLTALMSLCDQLEQHSLTSLDAHQQLVETLLTTLTDSQNTDELAENWARISENFDTLFITEASIDALQQTILQLAVMGKLVPQDPNDSSAEILLEQLSTSRNKKLRQQQADNKEAETMLRKINKLKKAKPPFRLPNNWTTVHLIELCEYLVDCHNKTAPYTDTGIPIIRTTNIRERRFLEQDLKFISQETYDFWSKRCPPSPGDIIFTREAPMGEALIIPPNVKWCLGQRTMLIRVMHEFVSNEFLLLALTEPHLLERASVNAVGLTVKHLRVGDVENLNIPLPPLNE